MPWGSQGVGGTLPGPAGGGGTLPGPAGGVPWLGGYPGRGVPCQVQPGGYPDWGVPCQVQLGGYPGWGGTLPGPVGGVPCQVQLGGYPGWGVPWPGGGTQLGQHREYLLHGGRYPSCVHAGGLSCIQFILTIDKNRKKLISIVLFSTAITSSGNKLTLGCPISFSLFVFRSLISWFREFIASVTSDVTVPAGKIIH